MTETIYSRLNTLEETYKMKQQNMLSEKEYEVFKKKTMKAIFNDTYISTECVKTAHNLLEENILTNEEYEKIKQKFLDYKTTSVKHNPPKNMKDAIFNVISKNKVVFWLVMILLWTLNLFLIIVVKPILFFLNVIVLRNIFKIK